MAANEPKSRPPCETRIPSSKETRRQIRLVMASDDTLRTYDETLAALVDAYTEEENTPTETLSNV